MMVCVRFCFGGGLWGGWIGGRGGVWCVVEEKEELRRRSNMFVLKPFATAGR